MDIEPLAIAMSPITITPLSRRAEIIKRGEDILIGGILLILFTPLLLTIAVVIKLTSSGPVLFKQDRRGRHNQPFLCWKFRTMYEHATDHHCAHQTEDDDPRVTPIGRYLRRHSLDELPQLVNVVLGDMSLIGPRPHAFGTRLHGLLLPDVLDTYLQRYHMRPGLTGWAQVNGWRGNIDSYEKLAKRLEHDLYYAQHWSVGLDMRILIRTFGCMVDDKQAH